MTVDDFDDHPIPDDFPEDSDDLDFPEPEKKIKRVNFRSYAIYLIPFAIVLFLFSGIDSFVSGDERFLVFARGDGAELLSIGDGVLLEGKSVGKVVDLAFDEFDLTVTLELLEEFRGKLSIHSRFVVSVLNAWSPESVGIVLVPERPADASDRMFSGADVQLEMAPFANVTSQGYWLYGAIGLALLLIFVLYKFLKKIIVLVVGGAVVFAGWYYARDLVDTSMIEELITKMSGN